RVLWSAQARLLDDRQPRDIVTNSSVVCNQPDSQIRVKHGQPVEVACSVPRLWLSLPGFTAYWTVSSSVQFYPVGSVSCAYPMDSVRLSVTFRVNVSEPVFARQPLPRRTFGFTVEDDVLTSGANSVSSADNRAAISAAVLVASALSFLLPAC
uniref:Ig-like domain-containing protein n=1 Tax=Macrostomum lignano TaxID=282301 RepID=A0A1I8JI39_9PLAT